MQKISVAGTNERIDLVDIVAALVIASQEWQTKDEGDRLDEARAILRAAAMRLHSEADKKLRESNWEKLVPAKTYDARVLLDGQK